MRSNIVLIDFENVQPDAAQLQLLAPEDFRVLIFIGANQARLPTEVVTAMQKRGAGNEFIQIAGNGPNALDFHIAYYIGVLSAKEPSAYFHIVVSRDAGFDPLIQYLKGQDILAARVNAIRDIPLVKFATSKSPAERLQLIADKLARPTATKPRTPKTLRGFIASSFQNRLSEEQVTEVVNGLVNRGLYSVDEKKATYIPPAISNPSGT